MPSPLPGLPGIELYFKDESSHPAESIFQQMRFEHWTELVDFQPRYRLGESGPIVAILCDGGSGSHNLLRSGVAGGAGG